MNDEVLAAAAVYLYSAYNNFLEAHLNTRSKAIQKYKIMKMKQLRRNCWLDSSRNKTRKRKKQPELQLPVEPREEVTCYFIPMSNIDFEYILEEITPIIDNYEVANSEAMPPKNKLALTLKYLATGDSYESLSTYYNVSTEMVAKIIPNVCSAINDLLRDMLKLPASEDEWLSKAEVFHFPYCLGALDKKQIALEPPPADTEEDSKGIFNIELFTLVDSDCCFTYADLVTQDRKNDNLLQKIYNGTLELPANKKLSENLPNMPYVFLGDETFSLSKHIMVPFKAKTEPDSPEAVFNERLTRTRVVVENAFGIMTSVFKVFHKPLQLEPENASIVTNTCVLLHNFLRKSNSSRNIYSPPDSLDMYTNHQLIQQGSWRNNNQNNFIPYQSESCKVEDDRSVQTRLDFMNYFYSNRQLEKSEST